VIIQPKVLTACAVSPVFVGRASAAADGVADLPPGDPVDYSTLMVNTEASLVSIPRYIGFFNESDQRFESLLRSKLPF